MEIDQAKKTQIRADFRKLRFGMFIHFGLYSLGETHEWHLHVKAMEIHKYANKFLTKFDPDPAGIEQWVITAKAMGAKYLVCTSKHHDGFCLWDSKVPHLMYPEYHIRNTPFYQKHQKGVLDYLFEAGRKHGIKIGLYHSVIDWSWTKKPFFKFHPHLNADPEINKKYVEYYLAQLHELQTLYPDNICFWFDGYQFEKTFPTRLEQDRVYNDLSLHYPNLLVEANTGKTSALNITGKTDVLLLENSNRDAQINHAITPQDGSLQLPGELCLTLNRHWGYNSKDHDYKTPENIVNAVKQNDSLNTNTLLNFGPHWNGYIVEEQVQIAKKIGNLLSK